MQVRNLLVFLIQPRLKVTLNALHKMDLQLGNYLRGQVLDALIVGLLSILALWILGLDYFVLVGAFAGFCNMIPYLGPMAGSVLAVAVSFFTGGSVADALAIVAAFTGIQLVDNAAIHPLAVARNVRLHPLLIVLAILIGGRFFGFLGLVLAVPAVAALLVVGREAVVTARRGRCRRCRCRRRRCRRRSCPRRRCTGSRAAACRPGRRP